MSNSQIVTLTLFKFQGFRNKYWAFKGMQLNHSLFNEIKGLTFYKILGTGGGKGFKWYPNFSTYALLCVWDTEDSFVEFQQNNKAYQVYNSRAVGSSTIYLKCIKSNGLWSGVKPFIEDGSVKIEKQMAVLTRATIRTKHLPAFWKKVSKVSNAIMNFEDNVFSIGIGEWPVFQQATFSIWKNLDSMKNYAYKHPLHKEVVSLTREHDWYKEELFARFAVVKMVGKLE